MNNGGIEMAAKSNPHVSVPQWQQQTRWTQVTPLLQQNQIPQTAPFAMYHASRAGKQRRHTLSIIDGWRLRPTQAYAFPSKYLTVRIPAQIPLHMEESNIIIPFL